jgi:hypothetical protein
MRAELSHHGESLCHKVADRAGRQPRVQSGRGGSRPIASATTSRSCIGAAVNKLEHIRMGGRAAAAPSPGDVVAHI